LPLPTWPGDVPYLQRRQDWKVSQPFIGPIETEMEGGNLRQRSRPGSNVATVQWRRRMTVAQYASFDAFVRATLSNGTSRFTMPVWLGTSYVTQTVQIAKDSLAVEQDGLFISVSMTLRVYGM
jgi:hypothetical protein